MSKKIKQILVLAGDADKNIGDRGIISAMCQAFILNDPSITIGLVSSSRFFADRFPDNVRLISKGLGGFFSRIRFAASSDMLICGGGGLFQDDDSRIKMPYWGIKLAFYRLFCRRISGYSIGAGPLQYPLSQLFARVAFSCMERITVRDSHAQECCKHLSAKPVRLLPDPALILQPVARESVRKYLSDNNIPSDRILLGVTFRRWFHHVKGTWIPHKYAEKYHLRPVPKPVAYDNMIALLAATLDKVIDKTGAHVVFLPTYNATHEADDQTCNAIRALMRQDADTSLLYIDDPMLYKGITRELDGMFASRMHPLIFAASEGTPVMGLSYNQKFSGFFELIDAKENLIDIDSFVNNKAVENVCSGLCEMLAGQKPIDAERIQQLQLVLNDFNKKLLHSQ